MSASQLPTARRSTTDSTRPLATSDAGVTAGSQLVLGRYRLAHRLGVGAFGIVWMARDERLDRDVAVKIVPRGRLVGGRFEREARAAARLTHPGIVTLYEAAIDDVSAYLVSELVRGSTLDQLLDAGRLSDRDIIVIGVALCDALSHAHAEGVVHRDVKPSNVLIPDRPSSTAHPAKLTDFGVARVIGGDSLTRTGDVVGTAAYMAPEQAEGREAGGAADLYALALVTYEALTGVNPVRAGTAAVRARRLGAHLPPLRRQRRDLPRELGRGIDLALRPRPRERGSVDELREALSIALAEVEDTPGVVGSSWPRTPRAPSHRGGTLQPTFEPVAERAVEPTEKPAPSLPAWPARGLAALAAAGATAWLTAHLLAPSSVTPAATAVLAAALVLTFPRVGWLALTAAIVATATLQHRPGGGLILLIAAVIPVALIPRRGVLWPVSAGAPTLGIVGLAGAWPALAARTDGPLRRAALGLTGWVWLVLAGPLAGSDVYMRRPPGMPSPHLWTASLQLTVHDVLGPIFSSGALAAAPVWAIAAVVLPWLLRGSSLRLGALLVTVWAATLVSATETAIALVSGIHGIAAPTAVAGALASAIVALSPRLVRAWRSSAHSESPRTELP